LTPDFFLTENSFRNKYRWLRITTTTNVVNVSGRQSVFTDGDCGDAHDSGRKDCKKFFTLFFSDFSPLSYPAKKAVWQASHLNESIGIILVQNSHFADSVGEWVIWLLETI
jgi:hypothetical protein